MAKMTFEGLDEYILKLEKLTDNTEEAMKKALYKGAGIVADSVKAAISSVPVDDEYVPKGELREGIRSEEKAILPGGFGIARFRNEGSSITTSIGFKGKAARIAAKVENGTSYMKKFPFIRRAVNRSKASAEAAMAKVFDEEINKIMN